MTMLTPLDHHPTWKVGEIATANGVAGTIDGIWTDAQNTVYLTLSGPAHDDEVAIPAADATPGGTLPLHAPTLTANTLHPKAYELINLAQPDGSVPAGWAVFYALDGVYVAWGLPSRQRAHDIALGHEMGVAYLGAKM